MRSVVRWTLVFVGGAVLLCTPGTPLSAEPFGGQIQILQACYNDGIYVHLSEPRGGPYIWKSSTRTYPFGSPRRVGQWLLGLGGVPTICVINPFPLNVIPGTYITMMGSSQ